MRTSSTYIFLRAKLFAKKIVPCINQRLNSPIKRVGGLLLVAGIIILFIGLMQILGYLGRSTSFFTFLEHWFRAITFDKYVIRRAPLVSTGTYLTLGGLLLSFAYDRTLGRVIAWVVNGR